MRGLGMGMRVFARGGTQSRRLATLLGSTTLVSLAALSISVVDANAACTVSTTGVVDCQANTTTTNTTNLNGATAASSDRLQGFDNGSNITGTVAGGVAVDGYGLQLALTNAGPNTIGVTNSGIVTTAQTVNALELNGNGALVTYTGTGTVSTTAGGGNAMVVTNLGTGGVTVTNNGVFSSATNYGLFIQTNGTGTINVDGSGTISGGLGGVSATASDVANINITSSGAITGGAANGIAANSTGGNVLVATGSTVSGGVGISATTTTNGTVTVTTGGAVTGTSSIGIHTAAANGTSTVMSPTT